MRITAEAKSATHERILKAATDLFRRKGWDATTTRDIAQSAEIATGTLFNYFESKERIAATIIAEVLERALAATQSTAASVEEDLFSLIWGGLRSLRKLRKFVSAAAENLFRPLARPPRESPGDSIRIAQMEAMESIVAAHGFSLPLSAVTMQLYWTLYLGIFSFWAADDSPHQEDTLALLDQSLKLFAASLRLASEGGERLWT